MTWVFTVVSPTSSSRAISSSERPRATRTSPSPLLGFAAAGAVSTTYGLLLAAAPPGLVAGALLLRSTRRGRAGRGEGICTSLALAAYGLLAVATAVVFATPWTDVAFLVLLLPGMLLTLLGSTALGVVLLRRRAAPAATSWLLAAAVPAFAAVSTAVGHNAAGLVPVFAAWAVLGASVLRRGVPAR